MKNCLSGKEIADNIRAERNRKNMTQEEVAKKLNISVKTYISYETDAKCIKATTLNDLASILNCKMSDFYLQKESTKREN